MQALRLVLIATDPVTFDGAKAYFAGCPQVELLDEGDYACAQAILVLASRVDGSVIAKVERIAETADTDDLPVILVAHSITQTHLVRAIGHGLVCFLPRTQTGLGRALQAVFDSQNGHAELPAHMISALMHQIRSGRQDTQDLSLAGAAEFSRRETDILTLVAEGLSTSDIAAKLNFSERTIKGALHEAIVRLSLRNRAHAVAYALRTGAI